jgi:soluble lytic murein transglycosylase-like protein
MAKASATYGVPLGILYSVGLTETGQRGLLDPFAMNIDGRAVRSASLQEALSRFDDAVAHGAKLIDIGCMQINQHWHGQDFSSVEQMFDVRRNVDYAARFLRTLRLSEATWTGAVARYNAGPDRPQAQRAYVCSVIRSMVQSGAGGWTPQARAYCE